MIQLVANSGAKATVYAQLTVHVHCTSSCGGRRVRVGGWRREHWRTATPAQRWALAPLSLVPRLMPRPSLCPLAEAVWGRSDGLGTRLGSTLAVFRAAPQPGREGGRHSLQTTSYQQSLLTSVMEWLPGNRNFGHHGVLPEGGGAYEMEESSPDKRTKMSRQT